MRLLFWRRMRTRRDRTALRVGWRRSHRAALRFGFERIAERGILAARHTLWRVLRRAELRLQFLAFLAGHHGCLLDTVNSCDTETIEIIVRRLLLSVVVCEPCCEILLAVRLRQHSIHLREIDAGGRGAPHRNGLPAAHP